MAAIGADRLLSAGVNLDDDLSEPAATPKPPAGLDRARDASMPASTTCPPALLAPFQPTF